jgi:glyoxylase-like metal-dependent hydrolase (beta-lactamase superfamily II)
VVDINEVAENIFMIDNRLYSLPKWGSVYLINEERKALVDPGPATSVSEVLDGIKKIGVRSEDIDYIIVTHIHLDHAGGAGIIIKDMPRAQVVVHHRGARYLANPARLVSSVIEAQGVEAMARYGDVVPVEMSRLRPVSGGDVIRLSALQMLKFIDAPGHAPHELCIYESRNNGLFSGDAVGVYIAESDILLPATQPPNFDLELWLDTINRLMELKATTIYFPHFGVSAKVQEILQTAIDNLRVWDGIAIEAAKDNGFDGAAERMAAQACARLEPVKKLKPLYEYLVNSSIPSSVDGYIKYYQKKHRAGMDKRRSSESKR